MEQQGLQAAGVGSELVPDDFAEQDHGDVVLHLRATPMTHDKLNLFRVESGAPRFHISTLNQSVWNGFFSSLSYTQNIQARGGRTYSDRSESR